MRRIVFEGIDGCGKDTQIELLSTYLKTLGGRVETVATPSAGPVGLLIRDYLAKTKKLEFEEHSPPDTVAAFMGCLFLADMVDFHHRQLPALCQELRLWKELPADWSKKKDSGIWVLQGRGPLSTLVYQWKSEFVCKGAYAALENHVPDCTIILDVPVEEALARKARGKFQEELYEKKEFLEGTRNRYLSIGRITTDPLPNRWGKIVCVDGTGSRHDVHVRVLAAISDLIMDLAIQ